MANFDVQIQALAGTATQSEMNEWMGEGIKEIINVLPPKLKSKCAAMTVLSNATPMDLDGSGEILFVTRRTSSGYHTPCREIAPMYGHLTEDTDNLIYSSTTTDPSYWIGGASSGAEADASQLTVFPDPTSGEPANVHHIHYATVTASSAAVIANFPDEAEYLVVLYAAVKVLHNKMNEKTGDLPSDLSVPVLDTMSTSLPSFTAPSDFIVPVKPSVPSLSAQSVTITGIAPSYVKPTFTAPSLGSVGSLNLPVATTSPTLSTSSVSFSQPAPNFNKPVLDSKTAFSDYTTGLSEQDPGLFGIVAVAPDSPSAPSYTNPDVATVTVSNIGTPPSYTSPNVTGDGSTLTATSTALSTGQIGVDAEFLEFDQWFTALGEMIEDDEDIELASAQIEKINSYIQAYNIQMQDSLNTFNKEGAEYQAKLQEALQQAQIDSQEAVNEASLKLQKQNKEKIAELNVFQSEISIYQQNVNKEVQQYSQKLSHYQLELNIRYTAWAKVESDNIAAYQANIQNELNNFNKENAEYQAQLKISIQNAQIDDAEEQRKVQKYQSEVQLYQAEVNATVQKWVNEEWNQNFQKYQTDYSNSLQEYQVNVQSELNNFNDANVEYQAVLKKDIQDAQLSDANETKKLQKYQAEVSTYGAELNANIQIFTQELTKNRASFDTTLQKYQAESQKIASDNQIKVQKFTTEINDYTIKLQKHTTDYTWLQGQYVQLKADYQQGLQILISGGIPQQQEEQRKRRR